MRAVRRTPAGRVPALLHPAFVPRGDERRDRRQAAPSPPLSNTTTRLFAGIATFSRKESARSAALLLDFAEIPHSPARVLRAQPAVEGDVARARVSPVHPEGAR